MRFALVLLALAACKDTGGGTRATTGAMEKMESFRDAMCLCKDAECAKRVSSQMAEWAKQQGSDKPGAMNADDQKRATEVGTRLGECLANATRGTSETLAGGAMGSGAGGAAGSATGSGAGGATGSGAGGAAGSGAGGATGSGATGSGAGNAAGSPTGSGASATGSGASAPRTPRNKQGLPVECDDYRDVITRLQTCETLAKSARDTLVKGFEDAAARWATMNESAKSTLAVSCQGGAEAVTALAKEKCGW